MHFQATIVPADELSRLAVVEMVLSVNERLFQWRASNWPGSVCDEKDVVEGGVEDRPEAAFLLSRFRLSRHSSGVVMVSSHHTSSANRRITTLLLEATPSGQHERCLR